MYACMEINGNFDEFSCMIKGIFADRLYLSHMPLDNPKNNFEFS